MLIFKKIIFKVFGKTRIFIIILGWFLVITGLFMFFKPEKAKKTLTRQGFRIARFYITALVIFLIMFLISFGTENRGALPVIIMIAGIIILIKAYLLLKKKTLVKINTWAEKLPVKVLKIYAIVQTAVGIAMLIFQRRIWY